MAKGRHTVRVRRKSLAAQTAPPAAQTSSASPDPLGVPRITLSFALADVEPELWCTAPQCRRGTHLRSALRHVSGLTDEEAAVRLSTLHAACQRIGEVAPPVARYDGGLSGADQAEPLYDWLALCDIWSSIAWHAYHLNRIGEAIGALQSLKPWLRHLDACPDNLKATIGMSSGHHAKLFGISLASSGLDDAEAERALSDRILSTLPWQARLNDTVALARLYRRTGRPVHAAAWFMSCELSQLTSVSEDRIIAVARHSRAHHQQPMLRQGMDLKTVQKALELNAWAGPSPDPIVRALGEDFFTVTSPPHVFSKARLQHAPRACAQCGEVGLALRQCSNIELCSPECMAAIWPAHRQLCKKLALAPDANRALSSFTDWLSSLLHPLVFALPSAFDLTTEPANASTKILIIELTPIEEPKLSFAIAEAELVDLLPDKRQPRPRDTGLFDLQIMCRCAGLFAEHFALVNVSAAGAAHDPDWLDRLRRDIRNTEDTEAFCMGCNTAHPPRRG